MDCEPPVLVIKPLVFTDIVINFQIKDSKGSHAEELKDRIIL